MLRRSETRDHALRAAEQQVLEMIADGSELSTVVSELCAAIDAQTTGALSFVCLMDPNGKELRPVAGPQIPAALAAAITPFAIGPNRGSCGTAAFTKQRVVIADVATDPQWPDDIRQLALTEGVRAAWSVPLISKNGEVIGTFCLSYDESKTPGAEDLELIQRAGNLARIAVERARSEDALRRALDEIRESEATYRRIIDSIPTLAWCNLPDGGNEFCNQRWHDYTGIPREGAAGWGWQAAFHPDDIPPMLDLWWKLLASGEPGEIEARIRRRDGVYRWFLLRVQPYRDAAGQIQRWYGTSTDIEDLKRAQVKLRQDEDELRRITDAIPDTIIVIGADGRPIYANRVALDYTGLRLEEMLADDFRERIFHPEDIEKNREHRLGALAKGEPFEFEQRAKNRDGVYRWFLIRYSPFRDEHGQVTRWYATGTDIDERKRSEDRMRNENTALREDIVRSSLFEEIVGSSGSLRHVLAQVAKVAPTDSTVLVLGETGTGKELIARAIHDRSRRAGRAFIRVNCAAIPPSLVASELFGYEKGAFTGAAQRRLGRFESADGGTLFLDEVGELPPETQVALLRVLQEREFERVGGGHTVSVDVRIVAATNRDLGAAVTEGKFRQDLFYRLNVFPVRVPPLRDRMDDIPLLVEYLIDRYGQKTGKKIRNISKETLRRFQAYEWPGNIRELQNVVERAVILSDGDTFSVDETWLARAPAPAVTPPVLASLAGREKEMIETALREAEGRISGPNGAAARLGIPRQTLESKIKKMGINRYRFKTT